MKKLLRYVISVIIALGVGGLSALIVGDSTKIYGELLLPPLAPPSWLFPVTWSILYVLMGITAAMIYGKRREMPKKVSDALYSYAISLVVNFSWSIFFFRFGSFLFAFVWLLFLLFTVCRTAVEYGRISKAAEYLQLPYIIWLLFAGYLNLGVVILNR